MIFWLQHDLLSTIFKSLADLTKANQTHFIVNSQHILRVAKLFFKTSLEIVESEQDAHIILMENRTYHVSKYTLLTCPKYTKIIENTIIIIPSLPPI